MLMMCSFLFLLCQVPAATDCPNGIEAAVFPVELPPLFGTFCPVSGNLPDKRLVVYQSYEIRGFAMGDYALQYRQAMETLGWIRIKSKDYGGSFGQIKMKAKHKHGFELVLEFSESLYTGLGDFSENGASLPPVERNSRRFMLTVTLQRK